MKWTSDWSVGSHSWNLFFANTTHTHTQMSLQYNRRYNYAYANNSKSTGLEHLIKSNRKKNACILMMIDGWYIDEMRLGLAWMDLPDNGLLVEH